MKLWEILVFSSKFYGTNLRVLKSDKLFFHKSYENKNIFCGKTSDKEM